MIFLDWMRFGFQCLDGPVWSTKSVPASTTYPTRSVVVGDGVAVAVSGNSGVPYAVYSLDAGDTWNVATVSGFTGFPGWAFSPVHGNGWFFARVNAVQGMRSSDGQSWNAVSTPSTIDDAVGFAFGRFLIIGNSKTNGIRYSDDNAATWSSAISVPAYSNASSNLAAGESIAMFSGRDGSGGFVLTTSDGITWTRKSAPWSAAAPNWIASNGTRFVTVGQSNLGSNSTWYSDDGGDSWTSSTLPGSASNVWRSVIFNGGIFLAVAENSTLVAISQDGASWSVSPNAMVTGGATSLAADGNNYIAQRNATINTIRVGRCTG